MPQRAAVWCLFPSLLFPCLVQARASAQEPAAPKPQVLGVDVTFLANAGFFLESGKYSVLIDSFLGEPVEPYADLPDAVYKDLVNARSPFDGLALVLVSHDHPDHMQVRGLEKFLTNNGEAQLVSSPQILGVVRSGARNFEAIKRQMTPIRVVPGAMSEALQEEMSIRFFELPHGGKSQVGVKNLAHLIEMGGVRLLHLGDAEPTPEILRPFELESRKIDVVFVPYHFFGKPSGVQALQEEIKARTVVACHVPPSEWEKLNELMKVSFPDVILFKDPLEKRTFLPADAPGAAPAPKPGG
jgi:L-ascorbate metabolism protein UlaG (beta-lactamase superfamily)